MLNNPGPYRLRYCMSVFCLCFFFLVSPLGISTPLWQCVCSSTPFVGCSGWVSCCWLCYCIRIIILCEQAAAQSQPVIFTGVRLNIPLFSDKFLNMRVAMSERRTHQAPSRQRVGVEPSLASCRRAVWCRFMILFPILLCAAVNGFLLTIAATRQESVSPC